MDPRSVMSTSGHPASFSSPTSRILRKSLEFMDLRARGEKTLKDGGAVVFIDCFTRHIVSSSGV
eukprot:scaffold30112_cov112-Isochrysis_galbana.AAC.1